MKVYVRHVDEARGNLFTEIDISQCEALIDLVRSYSGFYRNGRQEPFHSMQLVSDDLGAYAEIIIGDEEV